MKCDLIYTILLYS